MNKLGKKATSLIVWVSAYVNVIVFALCGGYAWFKSDDETVKKETKKALIVTILFTAVSMIQVFVGQCLSLFNVSYGSDLYTVHQKIACVISIAKVVTYAVFALLAFFKNDNTAASINDVGSSERTECDGDNAAQNEAAAGNGATVSENKDETREEKK